MKRIWLYNAELLCPDGQVYGGLTVEEGRIAAILPGDAQPVGDFEKIDLQGAFLAPGFIDIHVHGGGGGDFMDGTPESFEAALSMHLAHGTTALCPTTLAAEFDELGRVFDLCRQFRQAPDAGTRPRILGAHLEGPYIAASMKGAQDEKYIRSPEDGSYRDILKRAGGMLRIWTVAPELLGIEALEKAARSEGVLLSAGHSDGRFEDLERAAQNGYTMVTHLYSSMSTIIRENGMRRPGILEAALLLDGLTAEVIADGMHLPPSLLRLIVKTKGADGIVLVTDAMRGAGMPAGIYKLGSLRRGQDVISDGQIARMPDGISFAGSVATTDRLVRVMTREAGVPLWQAVRMVTLNPARALGLEEIGVLQAGRRADLVVLGPDLHVCAVYRDGRRVWEKSGKGDRET